MKKYILILIFIVENLSATYMKVALKDNTYDIYSSCSSTVQKNNKDYMCEKFYVLKLQSKYNLFNHYGKFQENYYSSSKYSTHLGFKIITDLYTITPEIYIPNKSDLFLRVNEDELKKILQSKEAKVMLPVELFSKKLLDTKIKVCTMLHHTYEEICKCYRLEPTITLNISDISIDSLEANCEIELKTCKQKVDKLNSPLNRLKRFFN